MFTGNNMFQCSNDTVYKALVTWYFTSNYTCFLKTRNKKTTVGILNDRNYIDMKGQMGATQLALTNKDSGWGRNLALIGSKF